MRVMVLVKATADSERGDLPDTELLAAMGDFNQELVRAGVLLAADGLRPSSEGKRVAFEGSGPPAVLLESKGRTRRQRPPMRVRRGRQRPVHRI